MNKVIISGVATLVKMAVQHRSITMPIPPLPTLPKPETGVPARILPTTTQPPPISLPSTAQVAEAELSTSETVEYQKKEIAKELVLFERHLAQGLRINGKACDCGTKHITALEGLAQETLGITGEPFYQEFASWLGTVKPVVTVAAAKSGKYDKEYPIMAVKARAFRKRIA